MLLFRQLIQLLTEPPANLVYHLLTLLTLQAIFAIAVSQWRRDRANQVAGRTALAAVAIFGLRLLLLGAGLALAASPDALRVAFPLVEQAVNTATVLLIVWALTPHPRQLPRLLDLLLVMGLLVIVAMVASFWPTWRAAAAADVVYTEMPQAAVWGIVQLAVLAGGFVGTLLHRQVRRTLAPWLLLLLAAAHLANALDLAPAAAVSTMPSTITYWIRLGHLVVFPLWAVLAYRQSLQPLLAAQVRASDAMLQTALRQAGETVAAADLPATVSQAVRMVDLLTHAPFVGVAYFTDDTGPLQLVSNRPQPGADAPRRWQIPIADWTALETAVTRQQPITLRTDGSGAGQLYRFYDMLGVSDLGGMQIEPLRGAERAHGLLLLGAGADDAAPHEQDLSISGALAAFVAQLLLRRQQTSPDAPAALVAVEPETAVSGHLILLEEERDKLREDVRILQNRITQAENRATESMKRAHHLAAVLEEMEHIQPDERVAALEAEIETLRESLVEAEEAMALASAGEGGLSTDWVMLTITRYSGQLEEAQAKIEALQSDLAQRESGPINPVLISLLQELRTPLTSIAGFTNLLLQESAGILGMKQRDFLQRVEANTERMESLLNQVMQFTDAAEQPPAPIDEQVDVREVLETAVSGIITQVREKRLQIDLNIADELPPLAVNRRDLHQILTNLLANACQASVDGSRIQVNLQADALKIAHTTGDEEEVIRFMQLSIADSGGGIPITDIGRVFAPQHSAAAPLLSGVGDTGAGLAVAHELTTTNGGRIWVDTEQGTGSTFTLLFPLLSGNGTSPENGRSQHDHA